MKKEVIFAKTLQLAAAISGGLWITDYFRAKKGEEFLSAEAKAIMGGLFLLTFPAYIIVSLKHKHRL